MIGTIAPAWLWLIGGVLLLIAEIVAPGYFLVFVGAAAIATGLFAALFGLSLPLQLVLFIIYLALAVGLGRRFYAHASQESSDPLLNDRAARLIGRTVTVTATVDSHGGRVRVGDSDWSARGGPAEVGARVRITSVIGNCLQVEANRTSLSVNGDQLNDDPA